MDWPEALNSNRRMLPLVVSTMTAICVLYYLLVRPAYLSNVEYLGLLIGLEGIVFATWNYRRAFFLVLVCSFFWAGMDLPYASIWISGRWLVLAIGAVAGIFAYTRRFTYEFRGFEGIAILCSVSALVSGYSSVYPRFAMLKAGSLFLLFLYASLGARAAVKGREPQFCQGCVLATEAVIAFSAVVYLLLHDKVFGNPNSLGAVMGVIAVPIIAWGILTSTGSTQLRRWAMLGLSLLLLFSSYSRAGIAAAAASSIFLCMGARQYRFLGKLLVAGVILAAAATTLMPYSAQEDSLSSTFLYKGRRDQGIMGSRRSVWQETFSIIEQHPWFGSGFGTSAVRNDSVSEGASTFESAPDTTREHGNSYLAVVEGTGIVGSVPFLLLVLLLSSQVARTFRGMRHDGSCSPTSILLAAVVIAGLTNAAFEDWLFAPGYYLCVLFWAFAFVLIDISPVSDVASDSVPAVQTAFPATISVVPVA
jgi:hypothetical protein